MRAELLPPPPAADDVTVMRVSHPIHVALAIPHLGGGGAERSTLAIARGLVSRGYAVDILVLYDQQLLRSEAPDEARVILLKPRQHVDSRHYFHLLKRLGFGPTIRLRRRNISHALSVAQYLERDRPHIVLPSLAEPKIASLLAPCFASYKPIIVPVIRNHIMNRKWRDRSIYGSLLLRADTVVAVSNGVAESVMRLPGISEETVTCIYNPVVSKELQSLADRTPDHPWFTVTGPPIVLAAGRLSRVKDFPTLIRAFKLALQQRPLRLIILGEGAWRQRLERMIRHHQLHTHVSLPGWKSNPFSYMKRAAVFVLSSKHEGLPGVLIQALACGCPCISTDCHSGPREILAGGRIGPLVPVGDHIALAEAIGHVLDSPPDKQSLLQCAEAFSFDRAIENYDSLFKHLIRH